MLARNLCVMKSVRPWINPWIRLTRNCSSFLNVSNNSDTGVATVTLQRAPANALNTEFMQMLTNTFQELEQNKCQGIIIASSLPKIFSAGLDVTEFVDPDIKRLKTFWKTLQDMWLTLYSCPLPVVSAINGSAPAAGCLLAMIADSRVMIDGKGKIGVNEVRLGIKLPSWLSDTAEDVLGHAEAERAAKKGTLYSATEALRIGLVDELCAEQDLLPLAEKHMQHWLSIPSAARSSTKVQSRRRTIQAMKDDREQDLKGALRSICDPEMQSILKRYLETLKAK